MKTTQIKYYAKALVDLSSERDIGAKVISELESVALKIKENKDFENFLVDRAIGFDKKKEAIEVIFKNSVEPLSFNFILVLIKDNQLRRLENILQISKENILKSKNLKEVLVESVIELDDGQENKLKEKIFKKFNQKILLKKELNKDLLGGIRVTMGDIEIDASLKGKILRLRDKIIKLN